MHLSREQPYEEENRMNSGNGPGTGWDPFGWISMHAPGTSYGLFYRRNRSNSWSYSGSTQEYVNSYTGERVDAKGANPLDFLPNQSYELTTYALYETGTSLDGGESYIGTGHFGIVQVGSVTPINNSVIFTSRESAQYFLDHQNPWFTLNPNDKLIASVGLFGTLVSNSKGSFRIKKSGKLNFKYYSSGWRGNQYVKTTYGVSRIGARLSLGADAYISYKAYSNIISGQTQSVDYIDAVLGPVGVGNSTKLLLTGSSIPVLGEFVALYSIFRLTWDVFYDLGAEYGPINR
jgi:hypothetical protein